MRMCAPWRKRIIDHARPVFLLVDACAQAELGKLAERDPTEAAMASPTKGMYWSNKEVRLMLRCLLDLEAGERVMRSTSLETLSVFQKVVEYLGKRGHQRTPQQARAKFKLEKGAFFANLEENKGDYSDAPNGSQQRLLHELWVQGGCPSWQNRIAGSKCWLESEFFFFR